MLILLQGNDCLINYRIMSYYFRLPPITQLTLSQQAALNETEQYGAQNEAYRVG